MAKSSVTLYGKELRKLRIEKEEHGEDMARRLGISSSYLCMIERGRRDVPIGFTDKVAEAYSLNAKEKRRLITAEP